MPEMPAYEPARPSTEKDTHGAALAHIETRNEAEDGSKYVDFQEAELCHFEQEFASEMCGYDSAPGGLRSELDQLRPKLGAARLRLNELMGAPESERPRRLYAYKQARNELREAFKRVGRDQDNGGPPLD